MLEVVHLYHQRLITNIAKMRDTMHCLYVQLLFIKVAQVLWPGERSERCVHIHMRREDESGVIREYVKAEAPATPLHSTGEK